MDYPEDSFSFLESEPSLLDMSSSFYKKVSKEKAKTKAIYLAIFIGVVTIIEYFTREKLKIECDNLKNHVQRRSGNLTSTLRECWSDEFDYEKNGFSKLKEFLLNEIFKLNEKMDNLTGEVFEKYTINRK